MSITLVDTLSGHSGRVWNARWNPGGNILASCGEDRNVRLWTKCGSHWKTKTILQDGHTKTVRQVAWSPSGKALASASFDATTAIWDTSNGSDFDCTATLEGHESEVKSVSWSHSGDYLATCSRDKSVWVWEVEGEEYECAAVLNAHTQDVKRVVWHPTLDLLASASYDNTVKLFREDPSDNEWSVMGTLRGHESTVWAVAFSRSGEYLATGSDDNTVKIWREYLPGNKQGVPTQDKDPTWKCVTTLSGYHLRPVYDVAWSSAGLLATACSDNSIHVFQEAPNSDPDQPTFDLLCVKHNAHEQDVNSVDWHPTESSILASTGDDGFVKIWTVSVT